MPQATKQKIWFENKPKITSMTQGKYFALIKKGKQHKFLSASGFLDEFRNS